MSNRQCNNNRPSSVRTSKHASDDIRKKKSEVISVSDPGLLNRTAWTNAAVALDHIKKVRNRKFIEINPRLDNPRSVWAAQAVLLIETLNPAPYWPAQPGRPSYIRTVPSWHTHPLPCYLYDIWHNPDPKSGYLLLDVTVCATCK